MAYRIKIVRADSQFEVEGDKKFVLQMLAKYGDAPGAPPKVAEVTKAPGKPPQAAVTRPAGGKKMSASEFIRETGFKKHTDIVLAFGYYLEKASGLASFTVADINACYYEAKLESSNTSQMVKQNIHTGRMMPAKSGKQTGRKAFILTRTGEEFVEKKPSKPAK